MSCSSCTRFISAGSVNGAVAGALFAAFGLSVAVHYPVAAGLYGLCAFGAYARLIDDAAAHAAEEGAERRFKLAPVVWIFGLMAACAYLAEGASAEWGVLVLMTKGAGEDAAAPAFAAFAAAAVVCRLVGELLRRRLTEGVLMTGGSLTAAAAGLMPCFCENPVFCLAAFALPGAGLSPVVPLLLSRAGRLDGVSSAAAASLISVLAYGGLLVVPPVIGLIAEQAGLEAALLTAPVLCAVVVAGSLLFRQK